MKNTSTQRTLSKWEEAEQFTAAADLLVQRAGEDPEVAEQFLRKIGYYEAMAHQQAEEAAQSQVAPLAEAPVHAAANGRPTNGKPSNGKPTLNSR